jgi:cleavage and polyadenylation specificity factor subunit 2
MGQMFMYDIYSSRANNEDFELFTLDDIDLAFEKIHQLKYSQTFNLTGKGQGLQITPLPGGHVIGGTIWKILKEGEEEIIYAVDYNQHKERHLNGCQIESILKPTLLITDSNNFLNNQIKRRTRDEILLENILKTLRSDGNVLICTDTAGRVLELAHWFEQLWRNEESILSSYSVAMLNNVSTSVIDLAKSQVEWMNDKLVQSFESGKNNPFEFKHVRLCRTLSELNQINYPSRNKVVLASTPDLECGFSRLLFADWCTNPKNTIIFTIKSSINTLAHKLIENLNMKKISLEVCTYTFKQVCLEVNFKKKIFRSKKELNLKVLN